MNCDVIYQCICEPGSEHFGRSFGEWAEEWIRWSLSIPKKDNPILDNSGKNCQINQNGSVWFLAGTFGTFAKRSCTIPSSVALFFPIIEKECSFAEEGEQIRTEAGLVSRARYLMDLVTHMELCIDDCTVDSLRRFRAASRVFNLIFPRQNVYGVPNGQTRSVTDGYWIMLRGLESGKHLIRFCAEAIIPDGPIKDLAKRFVTVEHDKFRTEVIYELTIL